MPSLVEVWALRPARDGWYWWWW